MACYQVTPIVGTDEVYIGKIDSLGYARDIAQAEDALVTIDALAPECEHLGAEVQGELCGIRVKGGMTAANRNQAAQFVEDLPLH